VTEIEIVSVLQQVASTRIRQIGQIASLESAVSQAPDMSGCSRRNDKKS